MKTIKLLTVIASAMVILSACNSEQKKAEKMVRGHIIERLNDPASYESVSFSDVKKVKRPFEQSEAYKIFGEAFLKAKEDFEFAKRFDNIDDMHSNLELMKAYDSIMKVHEAEWNPETEYQITHKYRAKNQLGGVVTSESIYFMDTAFKIITYIEE